MNNGWFRHELFGWVYPSSVWYPMIGQAGRAYDYLADGRSMAVDSPGRAFYYISNYTQGPYFERLVWRRGSAQLVFRRTRLVRWIWEGKYIDTGNHMGTLRAQRWGRTFEDSLELVNVQTV
jgi:hypothetical protein